MDNRPRHYRTNQQQRTFLNLNTMQRNTAVLLTFAAILLFAVAATAQEATKPAALPRCTAKTQAGNQCKNYEYKAGKTCYVHTPDIETAPRSTCGATTASGNPCKARTAPGAQCHNHDKSADSVRCNASTAKGAPCKHPVKEAGKHCKQHTTTTTK